MPNRRDYYEELIKAAGSQPHYQVVRHANDAVNAIREELAYWEQQQTLVSQLHQYMLSKQRQTTQPAHQTGATVTTRTISPAQRSGVIQGTARQLAAEGHGTLTSQDITNRLAETGFVLGVQQPNAVIGTVLSSMPEFERVATNVFKYVTSTTRS